MKFASLNHTPAKFDFELDENAPYKKLEDIYVDSDNEADNTYTVRGAFISTKGKFGDHPVLVTDTFFIDLPKHLTADVRQILSDNEAIAAINGGKCAVTVYTYQSKKYGKKCYSINWVDVD